MNLLQTMDDRWLHAVAARDVQVSAPGDGLLRLDTVEVGPQHNKPRTNLLLRRRPGQPAWEFFVDDDLQYTGDDAVRRRLFTGPRLQRWLALVVPRPIQGDVHEAVRHLLEWLDSPLCESLPQVLRHEATRAAPPAPDADLDGVARVCSSADLTVAGFEPTPSQADAITHVVAAVMQPIAPCCPLVHGPSGCGKHVVSRAAVGGLIARGCFRQALAVSGAAIAAGMIFHAQRDERLRRVLDAAQGMDHTLVLLDQFDAVLASSDISPALIAQQLDRGLKLVAVARGEFAADGAGPLPPLRRRLRLVGLPAMDPAETVEVLARRLSCHPLADKVELVAGMVPAIVRATERTPAANPGAALNLLDALLARAIWLNVPLVGPDDLLHILSDGDEQIG
jgi:hypothetical protein